MKRLRTTIKRVANLSLAALILATSSAALIPFFAERASALDPSNINLMNRITNVQFSPSGTPAIRDAQKQTCFATFKQENSSPTFMAQNVFITNDELDYLSSVTAEQADSASSTNIFATKLGEMSITQAWKLANWGQKPITVIRFSAQPDGGKGGVNGGYADGPDSICTSMVMVPVSATEYRGWELSNSTGGWFGLNFTINPTGQTDATGRTGSMKFFSVTGNSGCSSVDGILCVTNFTVAGTPDATSTSPPSGGSSGGGGGTVATVSGRWLDAAHIRLDNKEVYEKSSWNAAKVKNANGTYEENYSLYFLKTAAGDRSKITVASGKACDDPINNPISGGTPNSACTTKTSDRNCVPFIAVRQAINIGREDGDDITSSQIQGSGDEFFETRINKLGGAPAQFYDYRADAACTYLGTAPVSLALQNQAKAWFYYSPKENKFATVFPNGKGNEQPFAGEYTEYGTNVYQGGANGCAGKIDASPGFKILDNFSVTWKFTDAKCASGNAPFATLGNIMVVGSEEGDAGYTSVKGAIVAGNTATTHTDDETVDCETSGGGMGWLLCPISNGLAKFADFLLQNVVLPLLRPNAIGLDPSDSVGGATFQIWSVFRIYGNIVLVIALLVAVLSQAFGGGVFEAYAARKMLPRILVSGILINISIYLVALAVDISRIAGASIGELITAPLNATGSFSFTIGTGTGIGITATLVAIIAAIVASGALSGGSALLGMLPVLFLFIGLPAALIILGIFVTVVFLQGIIIALIIFAPIAFALYCLPNTQKYFQTWWDWLFRSLLVYPIIAVIIALSNVMAALMSQANPTGIANFVAVIVAFFVQFLPLVLIPFAFKLAGGIIGKLNQLLGGYSGKLTEMIKGNPNDPNSLQNRSKRRFGAAVAMGQAKARAGGNSPDASWRKKARARFAGLGIFGDPNRRLSEYNAEATKIRDAKTGTGNDDEVRAAGGFPVLRGQRAVDGSIDYDKDRFYNVLGAEISKPLFDRGKALHGGSAPELGADWAYGMGKAQTDSDREAIRRGFKYEALKRNWNQSQINDYWAMATYGFKGTNGSQWFSTPQLSDDGKSIGFEDVGEYQQVGVSDPVTKKPLIDPSTGKPAKRRSPKSFIKMNDEMHNSRRSFEAGAARDEDFRVTSVWQRELERRFKLEEAGGVEKDGSPPFASPEERQEALDTLAKIYQNFDTLSQRLAGGEVDESGQPLASVSGMTAASQAVVQAAIADRQYMLASTMDLDTGTRTLHRQVDVPVDPADPLKGTRKVRGRPIGDGKVADRMDRPKISR